MASGIGEVRLYRNTTNSIPVGVYTDITSFFDVGSVADTSSVVESSLAPGTQYWFWVEVIDGAGNASAITPLGSITTASPTIPAPTSTPNGGVTSNFPPYNSDFPLSAILDGNINTMWLSATEDLTIPRTLQFTLTQPKTMSSVVLYTNSLANGKFMNPVSNIKIESPIGTTILAKYPVLASNWSIYENFVAWPGGPVRRMQIPVAPGTYTTFRITVDTDDWTIHYPDEGDQLTSLSLIEIQFL